MTVTVRRPGSVTSYRLVARARGGYATGRSVTRSFSHYVWRGLFTRPIRETGGTGGIVWIQAPEHAPDRSGVTLTNGASSSAQSAFLDADVRRCKSLHADSTYLTGPTGVARVEIRHNAAVINSYDVRHRHPSHLLTQFSPTARFPVLRYSASSADDFILTAKLLVLCAG